MNVTFKQNTRITMPGISNTRIVVGLGASGGWTPTTNEYKALLAVLDTKPSLPIRMAQDSLIDYLKGNNSDSRDTWSKLCCFLPLMGGMPVASDALFWWNDPTRKATLSSTTPTYLLGQGFYGNGSSSYIDTTFNPSTDGSTLYTQNDASAGFLFNNYRNTGEGSSNGVRDGAVAGIFISPRHTDNNMYLGVQGDYDSVLQGTSDNIYCLFSLIRESPTQYTYYKDKVSSGLRSKNSSSLINGNVYLLARNNEGTAGNFGTDTIGLFYAGSKLDTTDIKVLNDGIAVFQYALSNAINVTGTITVGSGKDYTTLNAAINKAVSGNTIIIDAGTYNENLILKGRKLTLNGSGSCIVKKSLDSASCPSTMILKTDCAFNDMIFDMDSITYTSLNPIINISGCSPLFNDCTIQSTPTTAKNSQDPIHISEDSLVTFTGTSSINVFGNHQQITIADTSRLLFMGEIYTAETILTTSASMNIDVDTWLVGNITASDDTSVVINVNTEAKQCDSETGVEYTHGTKVVKGVGLSDNASLQLSGNLGTGLVTTITGAGNVVLYKDIVTTYGFWWTYSLTDAATASVTFDNAHIYLDCDDDTTGLHIIESDVKTQINIINGSVLEFSGHQGLEYTMGNPIVNVGKLYIRNSTIIDNIDDDVPFGANYGAVVSCHQIDAENSIFTNQNWDSVGPAHASIYANKVTGEHLEIRLVGCTFNNSEMNGPVVYQGNDKTYDSNDYYCESGSVKNTTGLYFDDYNSGGNTALAILRANCPD